jgi:sirohydrochlorin cobaltochelatase
MSEAQKLGVILFAHGARDARWAETLAALAQRVQQRLPQALITTAFLEFQAPTLDEALADAAAAGCTRVDLLPVFWAAGGHIVDDLPPLLTRFRVGYPQVELRVQPVLSELPGMLDFIADTTAALAMR